MRFSYRLELLLLLTGILGSVFGTTFTIRDTTTSNSSGCLGACNQLDKTFSKAGKHIVSGIGGTSNLTLDYFSLQQGTVVPTCLVKPTNADDVLSIVTEADRYRCPFAVRSGGHSTIKGASNAQDGITIDMTSINEVAVSKDRASVVVGSGNTWLNVYTHLEPKGLVVLGGRDADVGVGGLLLGGGVNFFSSLYGFSCDNVINYEVVIGGNILQVNYTSYPDLYFALRGGGNNFGVVTRFTLNTYPQKLLWGGGNIYAPAQFDAVTDAMYYINANAASDPKGAAVLAFVYNYGRSWVAEAELVYVDPVANPPILQNFTSLPEIRGTMKMQNISGVAMEVYSYDINHTWQTYWSFTYKNDQVLAHNLVAQCQDNVKAFLAANNVPGFSVICMFVPLSKPMLERSSVNGGNALGLTPDSALIVFQLSISWNNAADQPAVFQFAKDFIAQGNATAHSMGLSHPFVYQNHAAAAENPFFGYGATNLAKLRAASKKYDPRQTFQKWVPGYFKL